MPKIKSTKPYVRKLRKFVQQIPSMQKKYFKTILYLGLNPHHPSLRLHKLKDQLTSFYSFSINMKFRIAFDFIIKEDDIILIDIGDHRETYF